MVTLLVAAAFSVVLIACSTAPPLADFEMSGSGGPVPAEIKFTPIEPESGVSYQWEFGDGGTSDEVSPSHTFEDAGEFPVRLTASKGDTHTVAERRVVTEPGEAGWIITEPASLSLESGERQRLSASAFDVLGNPVPDVSFRWTVDPDAGEILPDGTFVAGPEVGSYRSAVKVEFERLEKTVSADVPVEIGYGVLDSLIVQPELIDLRVNNRVDLKVIPRDRQGHVLPEPDIDWSPVRAGIDIVEAGGDFRAGLTPTTGEQDLVEVEVSIGGKRLTRMLRGRITAGILDRLEVEPSATSIAVGEDVSFSVTAFDRFDNELELESLEYELVSPELGVLSEDGVFTAAGEAASEDGPLVTATGRIGKLRSFAEIMLDVRPGPADAILVTPRRDSIPVGAANPFNATVVDASGNFIEDVEVVWSVTGGGSITEGGVFIAGFETGEFPGAAVATVPAGAAGNLRDITAAADMFIRTRSSDLLAIEVSSDTDINIVLIDLVKAELRSLSPALDEDAGIEISPAWWPDGSRLAFASDVSGLLQVYDIDVDTGDVRQLVDDPDGSVMPAISPDGKKIAYVATSDPSWQVYVADLPQPDPDGNVVPVTREQATRVTEDEENQHLLPFWSPDGASLLVSRSEGPSDVVSMIITADGSQEPREIGEIGMSGFGWSGSGEFVLVVDNQSGGEQSLLVVDVESGEVAGLVPIPFQAFIAAWAPDSTELAVVDRSIGHMWLMDADGTSLRVAVDTSQSPRRAAWRPVPIDTEVILAGDD